MDEPPTNRFNDGKVGPDGCFWVGSMDERTPRQKTAFLYRITPDGRTERKADGYAVSNGLAWSPDGRIMYHSDSTARIIEAWDFDSRTGALAGHRVLATLTNEDGRPDGAAVDAEGAYWSAVRQPAASIASPLGRAAEQAAVPGSRPTMPCFAERHLYVTTLREVPTFAGSAATVSDAGRNFRVPMPPSSAHRSGCSPTPSFDGQQCGT